MKYAKLAPLFALVAGLSLFADDIRAAEQDATIELMARSRQKQKDGSYKVAVEPKRWLASKTAVIVCDMWDDHYCVASAKRVGEMAPHMNKVLIEARKRGALIIHCPSGCMNVYKNTPQRKLAQSAPKYKTKIPVKGWCYLDKAKEGELPIDDSDPCEDEKPREKKRFYSKQHDALKIEAGDAITDSVEALYLMKQKGIENVILMGVHTNMCVLGRPFGIRQLVTQGKNVVLMRDMTDSMYSPKCRPYVSHFRGTELVIGHIEKHWCPSITSTDLTGKAAFRFAGDKRPKVLLVGDPGEYDANKTMPNFADELRSKYGCYAETIVGRGKGGDFSLPGIDALESSDTFVLFLRRRALPPTQLDQIRAYLEAGKPLVALRTTSHGFDARKPPEGKATWAKFDIEVLGCDYRGHGPGSKGTDVTIVAENQTHPILANLTETKWHSKGSLYYSRPVDPKATLLLTGALPERKEPVAWTRTYKGRVFYTSLGHPADFERKSFRRMMANAVFWSMDRRIPAK